MAYGEVMTQTLGKIGGAVVLAILGFMALSLVLGAVTGVFRFAIFIVTAVAFIDAVVSQKSIAAKAVWGALILFVPVIGALGYWAINRRPALPAGR